MWTLRYWFKNATSHIEIVASASGSDFLVSVPAATTAVYPPGHYGWTATVDKGTDKYQVGSGQTEVLPRVDTTGLLDQRSDARQIYDDLVAMYKSRTSSSSGGGGIQHYQIGDRQITYKTSEELIKDIEYWRAQVAAEEAAAQIAAGLGNPRRLYTRFGSAS